MPDYVLERLALDLRAPELNIPLDIGGSRGRQFTALSQPALQEIRHGRTVLLDRGRVQPPGLGQIPEVAPARHVHGVGGFDRLQPPRHCQETGEGPFRAPLPP